MAERRFTIQLDAQMNISQVKTAVQGMQTELNKLNLPPEIGNKISTTLTNLTSEVERFQAKAAKGISSTTDFTQISRSGEKVIQLYEQLRNQVADLGGLSKNQLEKLFPPKAIDNIKKANTAYDTYTAAIKKNNGELEKAQKNYKEATDDVNRLNQKLAQLRNTKPVSDDTMSGWKKGLQESTKECETLQAKIDETKIKIAEFEESHGGPKASRKSSKYRSWQEELQNLTERYNAAKAAQSDFESKTKSNMTFSKQTSEIKKYEGQLETAQSKLQSFSSAIVAIGQGNTQAFETLVTTLNQINGINLDPAKASIEDVIRVIQNLSNEQINQVHQRFQQLNTTVNGASSTFDILSTRIEETRAKVQQLDTKLSEVNALKSRIQYFFGLTNSVYLFRRAVTSAFETVKELDAAMTETAVVTDFTVGDMWEKLPEYTKNASALGATTEELYNATTLYYQQGLKGNEVMAVGIETMKMARIAGMEAAEATEAMTAALRGFNMEVNETNAVRVNDVYSELAAITAADTEQIATAMSKTASIAANANMEFETTAALLAQIIETTQEAPETAGTAMKTIIARFSEVKELQSRGEKTGKDSEGEEIDINKIDKALKTVGISMNEFFAGTKGLDEILLELAEKWESLDFTTQRYIATTAAGSRQQSRFIAMMSDYSRTIELVDAANNSAGASQRQFEKTLDSLEAKMNKLTNAWDEFLMGLANHEFIKAGVDILTTMLTILNGIVNFLSFDGEIPWLKSLLTLGAVLGGLKGGKFLLNKGFSLAFGDLDVEKQTQESLLNKMRVAQENALHKQQLANQAKEHAAELKAIQETKLAALSAEKEKRIAALHSEETEKIAAIGGEETEGAAAIHSEYAEKIAGIESEIAVQQVAIANDQVVTQAELMATEAEKAAAIAGEEAEKAASLASEETESSAAVAGEEAEAAAVVSQSTKGGAGLLSKTKDWFSKNGKMLGWTAAIIASIAAVSGIINLVNDTIDKMNYTTEEKIADLTSTYEQTQESLAKASSELKGFSSTRRELEKTISSLDNLQKGGADWANAMHEVRTEINKILNSYPELREFTETINGVTTLSEKGWQLYEKKLVETQFQQEAILQSIQAQINLVESQQSAEKLNIKTTSVTQEEQEDIQQGQTVGGWIGGIGGGIGGAVAGAKILGALGSFAGPVGTLIGAIVGALGGVLIGGLVGGSESADKGISIDTINKVALAASEYTIEGAAFSAENATSEQIDAFLKETIGEGHEDFEELFTYISENGAEFDAHSILLKENEAKLYAFGEAVGAARAGVLGLNGQEEKAYENLFAQATAEEYDYIYSRHQASITDEYLRSKAGQKEIAEAAGYYYDDANNAILYSKGGEQVEDFTIEEQRAILASARTVQELIGFVDNTYKNFTNTYGTDNSVIAGLASSHSSQNPTMGGLSAEQLKVVQSLDEPMEEKLKQYNFEDKIDQAIELELKDIDTGLNISTDATAFSFAYGNQETWQSNFSVEVNKNFAKAYGDLEKTRQLFKEEMEKAEEVSRELFGFDLVSSGYFLSDNQGKTFEYSIDDKDFYNAIAKAANVLPSMVEHYATKGNLDTYFNESVANELLAQVQPYIDQMSFLYQVPVDTAIAFGQQVEAQAKLWSDALGKTPDYFTNQINSIFEGVSEENRAMIANSFTSLKFSNLTDLQEYRMWLENLDGVTSTAVTSFNELIDVLVEGGIAFAEIDLEALKAQIDGATKLVAKIDELNLDDTLTLTSEELDQALQSASILGQDLRDSFVNTSNGFVYLGDNMEELRDTIATSNQLLLEQQQAALKNKVETGTFIKQSSQATADWATVSTWTNDQVENVLKGLATDTAINSGMFMSYEEWIQKNGIYFNPWDSEEKKRWSYDDYIKAQMDKLTEQQWSAFTAGSPLQTISGGVLVELFDNIDWESQEGLQETIRNFLIEIGDAYTGLTGYEIDYEEGLLDYEELVISQMSGQEIVTTKSESSRADAVLDARMERYTKIEAEAISETLKQQNKLWEENDLLIKAAVADSKDYEKNLLSLSEVIINNLDILENFNESSKEYQKALDKITYLAKQAFGENITEDFVKNNLQAFKDWAKGVEGSTEKIRQLMINNLTQFFGGPEDSINQLKTILQKIDNLPFDEYGYADGSSIFKVLEKLIGDGEKVAEFLEFFGYSVTFDKSGNAIFTNSLENIGDQLETNHKTKEETKWENPYDKYYNSVKEINAELRKREQLERQYQLLIERSAATIDNITKNRKEQLVSLEAEKKMREAMLRNRTGQIGDIRSEYSDVAQYAWWDEKLGQVMIDWEGLERLEGSTDDEYTARVEDYISKMEEQQDLIEEEQDKLEDINDVVWEIYNEGKDEYFDLENQIKDAVIASRQKEIDKLSEINSTINDTNSSILESMQKQIDEYRQNRDNEEIEEQIADDERRLMYLQQDTSGANALDILELQKSIDEQKQDYTDTLIDQKISALQEQNEIAAEQRERQINILQTQLDQDVETGKIWEQVKELMDTGLNGEDGLVKDSDLEGILKDAENFEGLSALQQLDWFRNMETNIAAALSWLETGAMQSLFGQGGEISFKDASGDDIKGTIDENGNVVTEYGTFNKADFSMDSSGNVYYGKDINIPGKEQQPVQPEKGNEEKQIAIGGRINAGNAKIYSRPGGSPLLQYFANDPIYDVLDEKNGYILTRWYKSKSTSASGWFKKSDVTAFKTGGLADFTGPAWLDGTKSKPEYILNAEQTKAFFQLVDVLSSLRTGETKSTQNNGDNVYDIDINVESIGSDYDVEQIASTVKRLINDDARYRNNNTINLMR